MNVCMLLAHLANCKKIDKFEDIAEEGVLCELVRSFFYIHTCIFTGSHTRTGARIHIHVHKHIHIHSLHNNIHT